MLSYFNDEQQEHMTYLTTLKPEETCWCGWNKLGNCTNDRCPPDKTCADKLKKETESDR